MDIPKQVKNIAGERFGRLEVVRFVDTVAQARGRAARWFCRCDCGGEATVLGYLLRNGNTRSCGCINREMTTARNTKHGNARRAEKSVEYTTWANMKIRCYNPKSQNFAWYGGRGIRVCDRWLNGEGGKTGFECFLADMGRKPSPEMSLDRFPDGDGNYMPGNCRWASQTEQVRNSTKTTLVEVGRRKVPMIEAAEMVQMPYGRLRSRKRYGWSDGEALTRPMAAPQTLVIKGRSITMKEAAALSPISLAGIRKRLQQGWGAEAAVFTPPQKTGPKPKPQADTAFTR